MLRFCFLISLLCVVCLPALAVRPCVTPEHAADYPEKDLCITAHVYDVVEASDGTRYLDLCKPDVPDDACHFTVISLAADRREVGELAAYRNTEVRIRGTVHVAHGQSTILLSHARQFHDGAEKFRPNPALLAGFSADGSRTAFRDPAMSGHRRKGNSSFLGKAH